MSKARSMSVLAFLLLAACTAPPAQNQYRSQRHAFRVETVATNQGVVWGMAFLPDGRLLYTTREGRIRWLIPETGAVTAVEGGPEVALGGQGGLLDLALHPQFQTNHTVYLTYSKKVPGGQTTALASARLEDHKLVQLREIFVARAVGGRDIHYGSRLQFDNQGYLFMTVGERGERHKAQDLGVHNGKLLRLSDDGKPAPGNPFAGRPGALPEIWSYGHRNPQGLAYDPATGTLWEMEHGPRGGDEINRVVPGKNYGWPVITYGREYYGPKIGEGTAKAGLEQPVKYYVPSIAPSGLLLYQGPAFPDWRGDLFAGALKELHLNRVRISNGQAIEEERLLEDRGLRIREVEQGPGGEIFLSSDRGEILRLLPLSP